MGTPQKTVITAALPYANGSIHIGHLLEYIQADIYARFLKLQGQDALYICASDMHGTPIEVNAKKAGVKPEKLVEKYWKEHQKDFASFLIKFDNYWKTHSPENKELAEWFFTTLREKGLIYTKEIEQMYDEKEKRFLPDRYVKGTCPKCGAEDQYGDVCEKCGATYNPTDLLKPYSTLSNTTPVLKTSTHYFFKLSSFSSQLKKWIAAKKSGLQSEIQNWLTEWIKNGLEDWCISRDAPYFGFEIPGSKKETGMQKYFYVWLDAPIGYISSTKNYCDSRNLDWKEYWYDGQVYHIIGKDIVYFHYLFWPAMFLGVGLPLPKLNTHGFITVNGKKMSKSRGTFFTAQDFLKLYSPEALRFYYASHLDRKVVDVDLNFEDFQAVTNNVLMGNLGNFCYRTLVFAQKNYGKVESVASEKKLSGQIVKLVSEVEKNYASLDFKTAVKNILKIADLGNQYFQKSEPWKEKDSAGTRGAIGFCVNLARNLAVLVQPILPEFSSKVWGALGEKHIGWKEVGFEWTGNVGKVAKLVEKIEEIPEKEDTFPLQMMVGKVVSVKDHPNADSLYVLQVDFGTEKRQVVAGLKKSHSANDLKGLKTVFCTNLKKAKLRGEMSEAMIMIAEDKKKNVTFLDPGKLKLGQEVRFESLSNDGSEVTFDQFVALKLTITKHSIFYNGKKLVGVTAPDAASGAQIR